MQALLYSLWRISGMSAEGWVALAGLCFTGVNIWVTLTVRLEIQKQKTWVLENFITKEDAGSFLDRAAVRHATIIAAGRNPAE